MKSEETWTSGRLLGVSGNYWSACALHAGVQLGAFSAIADKTVSATAAARRIGADPRALALLLDALSAMKLLKKTRAGYANTPAARRWLAQDSQQYMGHIILHHHHLMGAWARLEQSVRSGRPLRQRMTREGPAQRQSFLLGMFNIASNLGPLIVPQLGLEGRCHILDLGGGPGTYSILMCRRFPGLRATVYDLPTTRPFAEKKIAESKLSGRIDFVPGDFVHDDIPGRYDAVWLSHILHGEGPEACRRIIAKAVAALEPGGMILVHEFLLNDGKDGPLHPALFSLNMLLGTSQGRSYSEAEIREMLAAAGVRKMRRLPLPGAAVSGVIAGIV